MPIYAGGYLSADKVKAIQGENSSLSLVRTAEPLNLSFQNSTSFGSQDSSLHQSVNPLMFFPQAYIKPNAPTPAAVTQVQTPVMGVDAQLAVMNAADRFLYSPLTMGSTESSTTPLPADASPASQFAAGFAAATALGNGHFCSVLGQSFSPAQSDRAS
jgi:lysozyme family protein